MDSPFPALYSNSLRNSWDTEKRRKKKGRRRKREQRKLKKKAF